MQNRYEGTWSNNPKSLDLGPTPRDSCVRK